MKKKRTRPTADDWARWAEGQRLLEQQIAVLERKIEERKQAGRGEQQA
jgi:hypothetical protein